MTSAFILRFQETCATANENVASEGTATITAVRAENVDADPDPSGSRIIPTQPQLGTKTSVRSPESEDNYPPSKLFSVIPRNNHSSDAGTQTFTKIRAESADNDLGARQIHSIPKLTSYQ
jgi:hypothetical protein